MIDFIKGALVACTPAHAILEAQGVGYHISISLHTYTKISPLQQCKLYTHLVIREDAHLLYGFENPSERAVFLLLISVSGVGVNTARLILSSHTETEVARIIATGDQVALEAVKGVGAKTAQRILIDLKDEIPKAVPAQAPSPTAHSRVTDEALAALEVLGFQKKQLKRRVEKLYEQDNNLGVEALIKQVLNRF